MSVRTTRSAQTRPGPRLVQPDSGFSLVEVLVALLVLSIGLLGIGKLVLFSARANDSAYLRTQATAVAYSILDAMHANRQAAINGSYLIASAQAAADPGVQCNNAAPCTNSLTLAQYDLYQWKQRLLALGPAGNGSITTAAVTDPVSGTTSTTTTITVTWDDTVAQQTFGATAGTVGVTLETIL
jgi:type IV pilus assembly protein PilV